MSPIHRPQARPRSHIYCGAGKRRRQEGTLRGRRESRREGRRPAKDRGGNTMSRKKQGQEQGRKRRERILKLDAVSGMDFIAFYEILRQTSASVFFS